MPFRQRVRRISRSIGSRIDSLFAPSDNRSAVSLPSPTVPTPGGLTPTRNDVSVQSETNVSKNVQKTLTSEGAHGPSSPPTLHSTPAVPAATLSPHQGETPEKTAPDTGPNLESVAQSAIESASVSNWSCLRGFLRILDRNASLLGPLKAVVDQLVMCTERYEEAANGRDEFRALRIELEAIFGELQRHYSEGVPPAATHSIGSLCKSIQKELDYVQGKQSAGKARQLLTADEDASNILACYRRIKGHLQRLSLNANLSIWKIVDEQATNTRLDRLSPSLSACYNSRQATELKRGECTPGTRVDVLGQMHGWVHDRAAGTIYWLNGMAGTGKTTIAYSLCTELDHSRNLGASFFCSRLLPECRDVTQIVPSISYQLAQFSRPFRCALSRVLETEQDLHSKLLRIQFEKLVVKPLEDVRDTLPEDLVVVIDALDECDSKKSTRQILEALLTKTTDLPVKFIMASRPEPEIRDEMRKQVGRRAISRMVLHELDKGTVQADIETYLRAALESIEPSEADILALIERAGILFIYAATVVRYIGHAKSTRNKRQRLRNVLDVSSKGGNNPYKEIDELYRLILAAAFDDPELELDEKTDTKEVLYTALCAREPLTASTISGLLGLYDVERIYGALEPLWSVLHVVESSGLVTTLHASFPDYMFDEARSKEYWCDSQAYDHVLTRHCLDCIKNTQTRFNICGLESSHVLDAQISNLSQRVENAIPAETSYACRYWATHIEHAKGTPDIHERVYDFLSLSFLLWMEVMNLTNNMHVGGELIQQAEKWCFENPYSDEMTQLIRDGWRFVTGFSSNPVSESTPHIYASMLLFWPKSSPISTHYTRRMNGMIDLRGTAMERRSLALLALWSVGGEVSSIDWSPQSPLIAFASGGQIYLWDSLKAQLVLGPLNEMSHRVKCIKFSPDGGQVVSGSSDGTIRVWGSANGKKTLGPLKGHKAEVTSIAYSKDNNRIVSGSIDCTIRVWDARTGKRILGPLIVQDIEVNSVAFSPDGSRIVAGYTDNAIRVWDVQNGQAVSGPLRGHSSLVASVAFSPGGSHIASGSNDGTIRIWDVQGHQTVLGPLKGHAGSVTSVVYSPDGSRIASGADDYAVRVWDAQTGQLVLGPLEGHTYSIPSVAFSPDSTRIVSGSGDKTIRMWDAQSQQMELSLLQGHTSAVSSVVFSPDGARIISGSDDCTVGVWDAQNGQAILDPIKGQTGLVHSVAVSPDGTRIVSGTNYAVIHVWDAQTGQKILGPLKKHTGSVRSVAFSFDGTLIISGSSDKTILIWDAQSGETVLDPLEGHTDWVRSVAFSPDGARIVSGSNDNSIRMWDAQTGKLVLGPLETHTGSVVSVAFSPDGTRFASGSEDKTICVWDSQSGQITLGPLKGHREWITSVTFSPAGTHIVSGSYDGKIGIWDAQTGHMFTINPGGEPVAILSVAVSPDATRIVSSSSDKTIHMWDIRLDQVEAEDLLASVASSAIMNSDGWVETPGDQPKRLVWIPSDLRPSFLIHPRNLFMIGSKGYFSLGFNGACIGDSWAECYQSAE